MFSVVFILSIGLQAVFGWGGLFNRFSPEMLSNLGYGGRGSSAFRNQPFLQNPGDLESLQDLRDDDMDVPCYEKRCTANEHCCPGQICVNIDHSDEGTCVFTYGLKQGELCRHHSDCDIGLICSDIGEAKTCQPPFAAPKLYNEECTMSSECDIHRGLCCVFQRRHRQAARKVCSYFKDPLVCIGPVASDQVKDDIERTHGEKRITSKSAMGFNHLRR